MITNATCELCKRLARIEEKIKHRQVWDEDWDGWVHNQCPLDPDYKPCIKSYRIYCDYCKHYTGPEQFNE